MSKYKVNDEVIVTKGTFKGWQGKVIVVSGKTYTVSFPKKGSYYIGEDALELDKQ